MKIPTKEPSASTYHSQSARNGRTTTTRRIPRSQYRERLERENCARAFKAGIIAGLVVETAVFAAVFLLWVMPLMGQTVQMVAMTS